MMANENTKLQCMKGENGRWGGGIGEVKMQDKIASKQKLIHPNSSGHNMDAAEICGYV